MAGYWDLAKWPYYRGGLFREVNVNGWLLGPGKVALLQRWSL